MDRAKSDKEDPPTQFDYFRKVIKRFNMDKSKLAPTLLPTSIRLSDKESLSTDEEKELMSCVKIKVRKLKHNSIDSGRYQQRKKQRINGQKHSISGRDRESRRLKLSSK